MKIISGLFRLKKMSAPGRSSAFVYLLLLPLTLFFTACNKSKPPAVQAAVEENTNQAPAVISPAPVPVSAPVVVAANPDGGADLKQLNHAYIGWIVQNRRRPKSFEEYVALSGVQVPPAPAGKKYVIDKNGYINLATN
jgi:hypothetical protein